MTQSTLIAHCGARIVQPEALAMVPVPMATKTYFPIGHGVVVNMVREALADKGMIVKKAQYALMREGGARMFAVMDLDSPLAPGVSLSIGVRNSLDKSLPLGFCAGNRVFVCDNLAFHSDLIVNRKHTRHGADRYREAIALAVAGLVQFREVESKRIEALQSIAVSDAAADSVILRAFEADILSTRTLPAVIKEWREPSFTALSDRNYWGLFNAFTTALGPQQSVNPQRYAAMTMSLQAMIAQSAGLPSEPHLATAS